MRDSRCGIRATNLSDEHNTRPIRFSSLLRPAMTNATSEDPESPSELRPHEGPKPRFTVVVPTRDRPRQLARCLEALRRLEPPEGGWELVIVDDGSLPPVELNLAPLTGVVLRRAGDGPARARNAGASQARGQYLAFLDDDCEPDPHWLRALAERIDPALPTCQGGAIQNALTRNFCSSASQLLVDYLYRAFDSTSEQFFCSNNLCVPTEQFHLLGGFDSSFPLPAAEDRDFCIRWREAGYALQFVPEAVMLHSHPMNLRGYWRQHYRYGRGAYQFHLLRSERAGERLQIEPFRFYWNLIRFPFGRLPVLRAAVVSFLLLVAQAANAIGFFRERARTPVQQTGETGNLQPPAGGKG